MGAVDLPSGLVTFVVTDIEGSTRLLRKDREGYAVTLREHHRLLADTWRQYSGRVVDQIGDGSLAVFVSAANAIQAGRAAQLAMSIHHWKGESPQVRIGVHTGYAIRTGASYVSIAVHQATRICHAANGGQVLISGDAVAALERDASELGLVTLGWYRVRDFDKSVELFRLASKAANVPPPRCRPVARHNLQPRTDPLIGRDEDLARLDTLIAARPLVTLVGWAGVGKTRLATTWALERSDHWADGVWFIDCSTIGSEFGNEALVAAIAATIGLDLRATEATTELLAEKLQMRELVLVLDGAERSRQAVAEVVGALLLDNDRLRIVVTATEAIRVSSECLYRVLPLSTELPNSPAVELLLARARGSNPDLCEDDEAEREAARLCRRLDGLPLAIEIAAARMDLLSPAEIVEALDAGVALPRLSDPTKPPRHHDLGTLLSWHTDLLPDAARLTLSRLTFFPQSFDVRGAQLVAGIRQTDPNEVPELLWSLLDHSLVFADTGQGRTRYRLLHTVRDVVKAWSLEEDPTPTQAIAVGRRLFAELGPQVPATLTWIDAMDVELSTLRTVLAELPEHEFSLAQDLACAVARYHSARQSFRVGQKEIRGYAARWGKPTPARVGLLTELGHLYARSGDYGSALRMADLADALREHTGPPPWDEVGVEKLRGESALAHDKPEAAAALARSTLQRLLGARGRARMWNLLGIALLFQNQLTESAEAFGHELAAASETGDETLVSVAYSNSAELSLRLGRLTEAAARQRATLELAVTLGQRGLVAYSLIAVARIVTALAEKNGTSPEPRESTEYRRENSRLSPSGHPSPVALMARAEAILGEIGLQLYDTDARATEEFAITHRRRLGATTFHRLVQEGRAMDDNHAVLGALALIDHACTPEARVRVLQPPITDSNAIH